MRAISRLQTFQSLQHYLELQQRMVFDIEIKKLLIRRNSRPTLTCFDFEVHINANNTWQKWKSPGHCERIGLLQASVQKFSRKTSTWKFCFSKIPGYTENRTQEKDLRVAASETRSFRGSLSGQAALLCIIILILLSNE